MLRKRSFSGPPAFAAISRLPGVPYASPAVLPADHKWQGLAPATCEVSLFWLGGLCCGLGRAVLSFTKRHSPSRKPAYTATPFPFIQIAKAAETGKAAYVKTKETSGHCQGRGCFHNRKNVSIKPLQQSALWPNEAACASEALSPAELGFPCSRSLPCPRHRGRL